MHVATSHSCRHFVCGLKRAVVPPRPPRGVYLRAAYAANWDGMRYATLPAPGPLLSDIGWAGEPHAYRVVAAAHA